jgi:hypothetical protein
VGRGECGPRNVISDVIHTWIRQTHGLSQTMSVWVPIIDPPVYIRERGGGGRGECGLRREYVREHYVSAEVFNRLKRVTHVCCFPEEVSQVPFINLCMDDMTITGVIMSVHSLPL